MRLMEFATFQERQESDDGFGNKVGNWVDRFEDRAGVRYLRGSEAVMAARLEGRQPVVVTIRDSARARSVTPEWRVIIRGIAYNIREPLRPTDQRRRLLECLAESGVAS